MRILIDLSKVNLWGQPSGISRVARQYIEEGFRWAQSSGIYVIPVILKAPESVVIYPVPGISQPVYLQDLLNVSGIEREINRIGAGSYSRAHLARIRVRRLLYSFAKKCRNERMANYFYRFDSALSKLARLIVTAAIDLKGDGPRIYPRQGDVLFCPACWHDVSPEIYRWIKRQGCDVVPLVHDILPISLPDYYSFPERDRFSDNVIAALDIAAAFLCVSRTTCGALREFASARGKGGNFATAYNGYYALGRIGGSTRVTGPGFLEPPLLMVGSIEPKKGHIRVIEQLEGQWDRGFSRPLVIVGRIAWLSTEITERIRQSAHFGRKLFWFQDFDDADLIEAYRRCHALVFASLDEGFGLPLVEASMCRKPTIAYRTSIAEEIIGEFALYFDDTPDSLLKAVGKLEDPEFYRSACAKLSNYSWPGWQERATAVFDCLASSVGRWKDLPPLI